MRIVIVFLLLGSIYNTYSQSPNFIQQIDELQAQIRYLSNDSDRIVLGQKICQLLSEWLKNETTFNETSRPKHVGRVNSPDKRFNVFTFNIPLIDGTHRFAGIIQMRPKDGLCKIYILNDISKQYESRPVFEQFLPERWYGSLYYEIIPRKVEDKKIYVLLGSCLNNSLFTNKKIIETLWFDENENPIFGFPLFDYGLKVQSRVIFEYTIMAQMSIHYNKKLDMIIFDHLAPSSPLYTNNYKFYGPDASYDGFKFKDGLWRFWPNINPYSRR
ncbi:MAG: hypothetical protein N2662_03615 [Bacteroidales bacterium]|nr:hypothetical protein [Bacteroidales bacterium]